LRAGADADHPGPFATAGDIEGDAGGAEQARGGLGDLLQRPLGVARGAGDGAEDFGAGGLTIPGDAQLAQEPGVLHRNLRLSGKALHECDLLVGERPHLAANEGEYADDAPSLVQRDAKTCPNPTKIDIGDEKRDPVLVGLRRLEIGNVDKGPVLSAAQQVFDWYGLLPHVFGKRLRHLAAAATGGPGHIAVDEPECATVGVAQPCRLFHDRIEHRREVAGRSIDDLQHFRGRGLLGDRLVALG
jgi:hypothetical protein